MKKLFKVLGTIAAVCLGVGIVLLVFGGIKGGINESLQYMRKHHRMKYTENVGIGGTLRLEKVTEDDGSGGMLHHEEFIESEIHPGTVKHSDSYIPNEVKTEEVNPHTRYGTPSLLKEKQGEAWKFTMEERNPYRLDIELLGGNLIIAEGTDSEIVVGGEDGSKLQCYQKGDTIHIGQADVHHLVGVRDRPDVVVYLPANIECRKIDIEIGGGTLEADVLRAQEVSIDVGAGSGNIEILETNEGDLSVAAGELVVNNGTFWNLDMEVGMGRVEIGGMVNNELQAEVGMGDVSMELADREENHNYSLEYGAGNITIGNHSYSGVGEHVVRNRETKSNYNIECGMGNIEIHFIEQ